MKLHLTFVLVLSLVLAACTGKSLLHGYQPVIDMKGVDKKQYAVDLFECQEYANQASLAEDAAAGALMGAALGAALASTLDDSHALQGAGAGAVAGGATGLGNAAKTQNTIVDNCMKGRGYKVLN